MPFLRNAWYIAAWAEELSSEKLLTRTILSAPVLLYREPSGAAVALSNICPHRFAPLHKGKLDQGLVECPYHGLAFGSDGRCKRNPHGDGYIPANLKVRSYPIVERFGAIWIWLGDPDRADESLLPDFSFIDPKHNLVAHRCVPIKANYMLIAENNLDLSHLQFMHPNSVGSDKIANSQLEIIQEGNTVWSKRRIYQEKPPAYISRVRSIPEDVRIDRLLEVRWEPPGIVTLVIDVTRSGTAEKFGYLSHSAQCLTPETESSTHQFFAFGLPKEMGEIGQKFVESSADTAVFAFKEEDGPILDAQQETVGDHEFMSLEPILLPIDGAAIRARRTMNQLIAAEVEAAQVIKQVTKSAIN